MQPIFHLLALGSCWVHGGSHWVSGLHTGSVGLRVGSARLFSCQHVGIGNRNHLRWVPDPMQSPNVSGFALQWNIGLNYFFFKIEIVHLTVWKHDTCFSFNL